MGLGTSVSASAGRLWFTGAAWVLLAVVRFLLSIVLVIPAGIVCAIKFLLRRTNVRCAAQCVCCMLVLW